MSAKVKYRAAVSERTFYPALLDAIHLKGGTGVQEVVYKSVPDISFTLFGNPWLLSVKVGESTSLLKSAFIQYLRHKEESGIERGILLLLPDDLKSIAANEDSVRNAIMNNKVVALIDAITIKEEIRGKSFPEILDLIASDIEPRIYQGIISTYSLELVIKLLREQVMDIMRDLRVKERNILEIITSWDLLSSLGHNLKPQDARHASRFLAAYIILSQILFLRLFSVVHPDIVSDINPITKSKLQSAFNRVLEINYKPIFSLSVIDLLEDEFLKDTFDLIWGLAVDKVRYELPGRIFHELMPPDIRKLLAAFYTRPQAAELLSQLCIQSSSNTVFDPACGSGTILTAAYREKLRLFKLEQNNINPHKQFCEKDIHGSDVMPFAVHLTCANLAAMDVAQTISHTRILQSDSLSIDSGMSFKDGVQQFGLFEKPQFAKKISGEDYRIVFSKESFDVIMMNPPFTKVERGIKKYVNMERYQPNVGGEAGLWCHFIFLADNFLCKKGIYGAVLPINVLRGRETTLTRQFIISKWTPLYIIKCTYNYGFSEWSEYRDILLVAKKEDCKKSHKVRFCLIKKNLKEFNHKEITNIRTLIINNEYLRTPELDIDSYSITELKPRVKNLMWFCGVTDFYHRDLMISHFNDFKNKLFKLPSNYIATGFRPDANMSKVLYFTREITTERTDEAFIKFSIENKNHIKASSPLGAKYNIEVNSITPSLRTPVGISHMDINEKWDYIAHRPYREIDRVKAACDYNLELDWDSIDKNIKRTQSYLSVVHRINPFSPNIHHVAFYSNTMLASSDQFNIFLNKDNNLLKAICVLLNSSLFFTQFFLLKEESTGRFINLRVYDLEQMYLIPDSSCIAGLINIYNQYKNVNFPSISLQFDVNFTERYKEFWESKRNNKHQSRFWSILEQEILPNEIRIEYDLKIFKALRLKTNKNDLLRLYRAYVYEMIMTRGLIKD